MPDESDWISEDQLATHLAVKRAALRVQRRSLGQGEVSQKNGAVMWRRTAASRVAASLGLEWPSETAAAPAQLSAAPAIETVTVVSQALNVNIVNCRRATGELVCVRVMNNKKYVPRLRDGSPMTLQAQKSPAGAWWRLVGREPRAPGQW